MAGVLYMRRPQYIEAVRWDGGNIEEVAAFVEGFAVIPRGKDMLSVETAGGATLLFPGDYVARRHGEAPYRIEGEDLAGMYEPAPARIAED